MTRALVRCRGFDRGTSVLGGHLTRRRFRRKNED